MMDFIGTIGFFLIMLYLIVGSQGYNDKVIVKKREDENFYD